ncbi:MAG: glutamine synthetase III [Peptoniphilaceae bacterium]|nr:glutamine synthetase III [Peptoniphilaceae bacterium]MDD7383265.1 glutamine synthetase III [Peptoniphilaceae bacterium]MDY3737978.1 glutamine synthetase III [Peptoniphilaceae bacterium]
MDNLIENFGKLTFNKQKMKERLPHAVYNKRKDALRYNKNLDKETADSIAHAMKEWALENGAKFYTHRFQPLNGLTAKKQESFLDRNEKHEAINRFSGKQLIKGEPDASSFPSGGMRSTFEARGYTYWDLSANSFIINNCLYIPSIFVSFKGEKLDKRAPLLESMQKVSLQGSRITNIFEKKQYTYRLKTNVGLEQEFFLIDKKLFEKRSDLLNCGVTLIGARAPKQQEFYDHYFGQIPKRVENFLSDVNERLTSLGIYAKTEHNEAAPCQFEIAIMYENTNIAVDDNQLCMTILKECAIEHDLECILKEKPFKGVNGSGKHNNYSIQTNYGLNCFEPGDDPKNNPIFLLFTSALYRTCFENQDLLRIATSTITNDMRLGGDEAPPSIISVFLGEDLEEVFKSIAIENFDEHEHDNTLDVISIGKQTTDKSDRNRTSPVAFTGNKFEFRMLGSSKSASDLNILINTSMARILKEFADKLEDTPLEFADEKVKEIVKETYEKYGNILFQGDNYSKEWEKEAERRGFKSYKTLLEALIHAKENNSFNIYIEEGIFTENEIKATYNVDVESISNYYELEIRTLLSMITKDIVPSAIKEIKSIADYLKVINNEKLNEKIVLINKLLNELLVEDEKLKDVYSISQNYDDFEKKALYLEKNAKEKLISIREIADKLEELISRENYSIPTYEDMFNSLR